MGSRASIPYRIYPILADGFSCFSGFAGEFKGHPDAALLIMYSDSLAHLIYAAADIVLVPSMFEPCGLTQLIAMRCGAQPQCAALLGCEAKTQKQCADRLRGLHRESDQAGIPKPYALD